MSRRLHFNPPQRLTASLSSLLVMIGLLSAPAPVSRGAGASAQPNYAEALQKSFYFYEAQRSGRLPSWDPLESTCRHASLSIL